MEVVLIRVFVIKNWQIKNLQQTLFNQKFLPFFENACFSTILIYFVTIGKTYDVIKEGTGYRILNKITVHKLHESKSEARGFAVVFGYYKRV